MTRLEPLVVDTITPPWTPSEQAAYTYELARAITLLRDVHYRTCSHGEWSEGCPTFVAWDRRRPRPDEPIGIRSVA